MVLHIANDYSGSAVYMNLIQELDKLNITQIIYTPIREKNRIAKNAIKFQTPNSKIIYSHILNYHIDRLFYPWKLKKTFKDIQKKIDLTKIEFIHAHTWYSDGGVAYEIFKKYDIPYIITIRNTDLNYFQKWLKYLHPYGRKILMSTQKIVLISASYRNRLLSLHSLKPILCYIENKIVVIPNGVDRFWIKNSKTKKLRSIQRNRILYIGKFNRGKNVFNLLNAIKDLCKSGENCTLDIVGGGGTDEKKIIKEINQYPELFNFHGKVFDKYELLKIFKSCDIFAMPSKNETFGLVYVEAMLQGLPILYTKDEGIDGFYKEYIGEKVSKQADSIEIKEALLKLLGNFEEYELPINKLKENHDWHLIANQYKLIYSEKHDSFISSSIF